MLQRYPVPFVINVTSILSSPIEIDLYMEPLFQLITFSFDETEIATVIVMTIMGFL